MKIKSFKQYITEDVDREEQWKEVAKGFYWGGTNEMLGLSEEACTWLVNHAGLSVTEKERDVIYRNEEKYGRKAQYPRENSPKDFFLITTRNLKDHFTAKKTMFGEGNKTIEVKAYNFMLPKNRAFLADILDKVGMPVDVVDNDVMIKKNLRLKNDKELYHFERDITNTPSKPQTPEEKDDYNKVKYDL